jgi:hypothetical protein
VPRATLVVEAARPLCERGKRARMPDLLLEIRISRGGTLAEHRY